MRDRHLDVLISPVTLQTANINDIHSPIESISNTIQIPQKDVVQYPNNSESANFIYPLKYYLRC